MQFVVLVEDGEGRERRLRVTADDEASLREGLAERGLSIVGYRKIEDAPSLSPADSDAEGSPDPGAGEVGEGPSQLLAALDKVLDEYEEMVPLIPPSGVLQILLREGEAVVAAAMSVLSKNVCRQISRDKTPAEAIDSLVNVCGLPEKVAGMLLGMSIDVGRTTTAIAEGELSGEEGIRFILENAPGAEEPLVRSMIDWILPLVKGLDRKRFLAQLATFEGAG